MAWLSIIPPLATIILTFKTKKLIPSLLAGLFVGTLIHTKSILYGITTMGEYSIDVLSDKDSAYTLGFLLMFGSLAEMIEMAGGVSGFSDRISKWVKSERGVFGTAWLLSIVTFFDSAFHSIAVGTMLSPLLEKVKGSKEKFAYILSVTSLQLILLIPIATAYLGYMVTLVANNTRAVGINENAYVLVAKSFMLNFFSWSMILLAAGVSIFGLGFGKLKLGKSSDEDELTEGHKEKEKEANKDVEEYPKKARNLIIPVLILIISTIFFFWWTGSTKSSTFFGAISSADYNISIFAGAILSIMVTIIYFLFQKINLAEIEAHIIGRAEKVLSLVIILVLSWALTSVTQDLGFNDLLSKDVIKAVPKVLIPPAVFLIGAVISYTIGSSWATWALMMPLAVAFAAGSGVSPTIMIGTVWAGGAVADVVSPLSAEMAGISFGEHLSTAFPYVLIGVAMSLIGYLTIGFIL